jgi:hypothetical protein
MMFAAAAALTLVLTFGTLIVASAVALQQQTPPPISGGGQSIGGTGVTQGAADVSPDEMARICNERTGLEQQQTELRGIVNNEYAQVEWAKPEFQKNADEFDAWGRVAENARKDREERVGKELLNAWDKVTKKAQTGAVENTNKESGELTGKESAVDLAKEKGLRVVLKEELQKAIKVPGDAWPEAEVAENAAAKYEFLAKEIKWTTFLVYDNVSGRLAGYKINNLTELTGDQLKSLNLTTNQMKSNVPKLRDVSSKLQGMSACDTTKLVVKDASPAAPPSPAPVTKSLKPTKHGGAGKAIAITAAAGGAAAAGVIAATKLAKNSNSGSTQSCGSAPEHCGVFSQTPGCLTGQAWVNALASYCQCYGFASGYSLGSGVSCP